MGVVLDINEKRVLRFLAQHFGEDMAFYGFAGISKHTGLKPNFIRTACRSLKRKGLAEFRNGLWRDDGEMGGSGYAATAAGSDLIKRAEPRAA